MAHFDRREEFFAQPLGQLSQMVGGLLLVNAFIFTRSRRGLLPRPGKEFEVGIEKDSQAGYTLASSGPVSVEDLHATIYTAMGISPGTGYEVEKRPFFATKDGHGKPVMDIFG